MNWTGKKSLKLNYNYDNNQENCNYFDMESTLCVVMQWQPPGGPLCPRSAVGPAAYYISQSPSREFILMQLLHPVRPDKEETDELSALLGLISPRWSHLDDSILKNNNTRNSEF